MELNMRLKNQKRDSSSSLRSRSPSSSWFLLLLELAILAMCHGIADWFYKSCSSSWSWFLLLLPKNGFPHWFYKSCSANIAPFTIDWFYKSCIFLFLFNNYKKVSFLILKYPN